MPVIKQEQAFCNMHITLSNTGKRFNREWIFRHVNHEFIPGKAYAITGPNGSGKSTLLQVIAGAVLCNEGTVSYQSGDRLTKVDDREAFRNISIATPYLELIEEMTSTELLNFHSTFKKLLLPVEDILAAVNLKDAAHKQIRYFSSGMKQRLKLAQAFFSDTTVLLLDEPSTNLDQEGIALYKKLVAERTAGRLLIISSNDKNEYDFCNEVISISDYKK